MDTRVEEIQGKVFKFKKNENGKTLATITVIMTRNEQDACVRIINIQIPNKKHLHLFKDLVSVFINELDKKVGLITCPGKKVYRKPLISLGFTKLNDEYIWKRIPCLTK